MLKVRVRDRRVLTSVPRKLRRRSKRDRTTGRASRLTRYRRTPGRTCAVRTVTRSFGCALVRSRTKTRPASASGRRASARSVAAVTRQSRHFLRPVLHRARPPSVPAAQSAVGTSSASPVSSSGSGTGVPSELVVPVVLARVLSILICHARASPRLVGTRTSGRRHRPRRRAGDRPQAGRAGGADPPERERPGPAPAARGRPADPDPDHARHRGPRRPLRAAPLGGAPARRGRAQALPGGQDRDRAADRERLLLRLRVPRADPRGGSREDRGGDPARAEGRPHLGARGDLGRGGEAALRGRGRALQGRARRHRRRRDLALHAGRVHRPLPRPAPAGLEADQGDQADLARGRLLARRREEHAADPDLRHRLLLAGRSRRVPRAARAGEGARPPPARPRARPLPPLRGVARVAVLAPEGDGALERARGPAPAREHEARLHRGEDAADLRQDGLADERPLGQVPREHVPRRRATTTRTRTPA